MLNTVILLVIGGYSLDNSLSLIREQNQDTFKKKDANWRDVADVAKRKEVSVEKSHIQHRLSNRLGMS